MIGAMFSLWTKFFWGEQAVWGGKLICLKKFIAVTEQTFPKRKQGEIGGGRIRIFCLGANFGGVMCPKGYSGVSGNRAFSPPV